MAVLLSLAVNAQQGNIRAWYEGPVTADHFMVVDELPQNTERYFKFSIAMGENRKVVKDRNMRIVAHEGLVYTSRTANYILQFSEALTASSFSRSSALNFGPSSSIGL